MNQWSAAGIYFLFLRARRQRRLPYSLTAREVEILRLIAASLTNTEIAERLSLVP
jgi:DNA-binding CsgD family transcriptional regulator